MPRTKGSKNHAKIDFDAQMAKLQKDKALLRWRRRKLLDGCLYPSCRELFWLRYFLKLPCTDLVLSTPRDGI